VWTHIILGCGQKLCEKFQARHIYVDIYTIQVGFIMRSIVDYRGKVFNELTVIKQVYDSKRARYLWLCKCTCGNELRLPSHSIKHESIKSCASCHHARLTINEVGNIYNNLLVIRKSSKQESTRSGVIWECLCFCGTITHVRAKALRSGERKSCGCFNYIGSYFIGVELGDLTILDKYFSRTLHPLDTWYHCKCTCGVEFSTTHSSLRGKSKKRVCSDNCLLTSLRASFPKGKIREIKAQLKAIDFTNDPNKKAQKYFGKPIREVPEYTVWQGMRSRCYNTNNTSYRRYGGRGITICDTWRNDFKQFYKDMGQRPALGYTIERIDNDKGYSRINCEWVLLRDQCRNRSNTIWLTYMNRTKILSEWAREFDLSQTTTNNRYHAGYPIHIIFKQGRLGAGDRMKRQKIQQLDGSTVINEFVSLEHAFKETGINKSNISKVCGGIRRMAGGYFWKYVEINKPFRILQIDLETGETIKTYSSVNRAAKIMGVSRGLINRAINKTRKSAAGYSWKREYLD